MRLARCVQTALELRSATSAPRSRVLPGKRDHKARPAGGAAREGGARKRFHYLQISITLKVELTRGWRILGQKRVHCSGTLVEHVLKFKVQNLCTSSKTSYCPEEHVCFFGTLCKIQNYYHMRSIQCACAHRSARALHHLLHADFELNVCDNSSRTNYFCPPR